MVKQRNKKTKKRNTGNQLKSNTAGRRKAGKKRGGLIGFLKDEHVHLVFGLFLILFSFFLLVAFTSYLNSYFSIGSNDDLTGIGFLKYLTDRDIVVHNWTGRLGAALSYLFIKQWFGFSSYIFIFLFFIFGVKLFLKHYLVKPVSALKHSFFWLIWLSVMMGYLFPNTDLSILGGVFGAQSAAWLKGLSGQFGAGILLFFSLVVYLIVTFNFYALIKPGRVRPDKATAGLGDAKVVDTYEGTDKYNTVEFHVDDDDEAPVEVDLTDGNNAEEKHKDNFDDIAVTVIGQTPPPAPGERKGPGEKPVDFTIEKTHSEPMVDDGQETAEEAGKILDEEDDKEHYGLDTLYNPKLELRDFRFPPLDLLDIHGGNTINVQKAELEANKNKIIRTLKNYSIDIERIKATIGPTVTLYEIVPAPGVRISKIKNLEDDIALSLSALGIRIIAPIPGKGTIGIEVPNQNPEIVSMRTILGSERYKNSDYALPIGLGKTIANESYIADLTKMPHLLIAGATGQGKSVGLNAIICSILYKKHPAEVKFVFVDPKKVELTLYSRIERHYLAKLPDTDEAIITENKIVVRTLNSLCIEMDQRYDLLKLAQVRNVQEYNTRFVSRKLNPREGHRYLPYIVLVVDEFADLIMTSGKEVEGPIARLAQLARAVGIHLIIATQRPSVNIITGTIKANFPARIAFRVTAKVDSRTILDSGGADQLVGRGDMLLSTGSDIIRLQCAFLDTPELEKITDFIGSQRAYPEAYALPEYEDNDSNGGKEDDPENRDELFEEAAYVIVRHQHGSTSLLQRKLKLGYNRAGRLIDQLEAAGIVGAFEGSKAREVLIKDELSLEQFLRSNNR